MPNVPKLLLWKSLLKAYKGLRGLMALMLQEGLSSKDEDARTFSGTNLCCSISQMNIPLYGKIFGKKKKGREKMDFCLNKC